MVTESPQLPRPSVILWHFAALITLETMVGLCLWPFWPKLSTRLASSEVTSQPQAYPIRSKGETPSQGTTHICTSDSVSFGVNYFYYLLVSGQIWRGKWQPTPVFLPGESHGQRSLAGHGPWGHGESDTTEATEHAFSLSTVPSWNRIFRQYSLLSFTSKNPMLFLNCSVEEKQKENYSRIICT